MLALRFFRQLHRDLLAGLQRSADFDLRSSWQLVASWHLLFTVIGLRHEVCSSPFRGHYFCGSARLT